MLPCTCPGPATLQPPSPGRGLHHQTLPELLLQESGQVAHSSGLTQAGWWPQEHWFQGHRDSSRLPAVTQAGDGSKRPGPWREDVDTEEAGGTAHVY